MKQEVEVRIEVDVPLDIFCQPIVQREVVKIFDSKSEAVRKRVNEILEYLGEESTKKISYKSIIDTFKLYFYKSIINEAVERTFKEERYNMVANVNSLLSEERLEAAIMGEEMIKTFQKLISELPIHYAPEASIYGLEKDLLTERYLGKGFISLKENKE